MYTHPCIHAYIYVVQLPSHVQLLATPWTAAHQASLTLIISRSLPKFMSIESMMPSNHLILYLPVPLLSSLFPSVRVFSTESAVRIRWPEYWSFSSVSASVLPVGIQGGFPLVLTGLIFLLSKGLSRVMCIYMYTHTHILYVRIEKHLCQNFVVT